MKNKMILCLISFIIGAVFTLGVGTVFALTYQASDIVYTPSDTSWNVSTVGEAINSLALSKTSDNYSTEEQVVGTWIDGKPIYQKTITGNLSTSADYTHFSDSTFKIDKMVAVSGFLYKSGQGQMQIGCYLNQNYYSGVFDNEVDGKKTIYNSANYRGGIYNMTIQYTKTTD